MDGDITEDVGAGMEGCACKVATPTNRGWFWVSFLFWVLLWRIVSKVPVASGSVNFIIQVCLWPVAWHF